MEHQKTVFEAMVKAGEPLNAKKMVSIVFVGKVAYY